MTPAQILALYLSTVRLADLRAAVAALVTPGDTEADVRLLCRAVSDALVPEELLPVWRDEAQAAVDAAGDRLADFILGLPDRPTHRKPSAAVTKALDIAAAARKRAAELAALPAVEVEEPA